jgi:hypothetical protein
VELTKLAVRAWSDVGQDIRLVLKGGYPPSGVSTGVALFVAHFMPSNEFLMARVAAAAAACSAS